MSLPYFPFTGETYKTQMGLKPLILSQWIERDHCYLKQVQRKTQLLQDYEHIVIGYQDSAEAGAFELYETLQIHLLKFFPAEYNLTDDGLLNVATGKVLSNPKSGREVLKNLVQLTQEDFVLMSPEAPVRLEAACVCFPSRWQLADKVGKSSNEIHKPVPKFAETVAKSTETFLEKIQLEKPMWRLNWTIHDSPETFTPKADESHKDLTAENVLQETFLRMERQTLRRLPKTQYVVFTIRTYIFPMAEVVSDPERRTLLKGTLTGADSDIIRYKGMKNFYPQLMQAL